MQSSSIEDFFVELNLRCKKWLLSCSYNSHRSLISEHLGIIGKDLDLLSANYDKIFLIGDFNAEPHDHFLMDFCNVYNLKNLIKVPTCPSCDVFLRKCKIALDSRAPLKCKYLRSNHRPFMNEDISKAIMDRTRLRHKFLRSRSIEDRKAYNRQRNYCVSLIRKLKKDYHNNLDYKKIIDKKSFWKYVKPLFTEKNTRSNKITLVEDNSILENNDKVAETFNNFFTSAISNLNIPPFVDPSVEIDHIEDPTLRIIEQYKNHPSVAAINEKN